MKLSELLLSYEAVRPEVETSNLTPLELERFLPEPMVQAHTLPHSAPSITHTNTSPTILWIHSSESALTPVSQLVRIPSNWDLNASLQHLTNNFSKTWDGKCAAHVWNALEAGGIKTARGHAKDVVKNQVLEKAGFTKIHSFWDHNGLGSYVPQKGDIIVSAPDNNPKTSGHHIAMYDGKSWGADTRLKGYDVYGHTDNLWYIYRKI